MGRKEGKLADSGISNMAIFTPGSLLRKVCPKIVPSDQHPLVGAYKQADGIRMLTCRWVRQASLGPEAEAQPPVKPHLEKCPG